MLHIFFTDGIRKLVTSVPFVGLCFEGFSVSVPCVLYSSFVFVYFCWVTSFSCALRSFLWLHASLGSRTRFHVVQETIYLPAAQGRPSSVGLRPRCEILNRSCQDCLYHLIPSTGTRFCSLFSRLTLLFFSRGRLDVTHVHCPELLEHCVLRINLVFRRLRTDILGFSRRLELLSFVWWPGRACRDGARIWCGQRTTRPSERPGGDECTLLSTQRMCS